MSYSTINPYTEELVREFPEHSAMQVEQALADADAVFHSSWSQGPIEQRLPTDAKAALY